MARNPPYRQPRRAILPIKNDILFAHKAINLMPDLSAADKSVAAAILDHCNKKTGQCDPSLERLERLLGINRSTVTRATKNICSKRENGRPALFEKHSHSGSHHRAFYQPRWEIFRLFVKSWDDQSKMKFGQLSKTKCAKLSTWWVQEGALDGCENEQQYSKINSSNQPVEMTTQEIPEVEVNNAKPKSSAKPHVAFKGFGIGKGVPIRQSPSRSNVAEGKAHERIDTAMRALGSEAYEAYVATISQKIHDQATKMEINKPYSGVAFLKKWLQSTAKFSVNS